MIPTLPEGARLALLNWPGGQPDDSTLARVAGMQNVGMAHVWPAVAKPLLDAKLIEYAPRESVNGVERYRLTQAGRKAVDVLQSGVE